MRRFERRSKLTHRRIRIGQPQGYALVRSASDDAHLAGSWPGRPSLTFQSRSAPLPRLSADCHRWSAPAANPESARRARCRTQLSAERLVTSQGWLPASAGAGRGCITAPRPWLLPALAPGALPGSPRPRYVTRWGGCPPRSELALRPLTAAALRLRRRGKRVCPPCFSPPVRRVGSCETHLTGDRSCSIRTNR